MPMHAIDLDWSVDGDGLEAELSEFRIKHPRVTFSVKTEHGPGGGAAIVRLTSAQHDALQAAIVGYSGGDMTSARELMNVYGMRWRTPRS